jgi:integrase
MPRRTDPVASVPAGGSKPDSAGAPAGDEPFEIGGYYLARPHPEHAGIVYACRYDPGAGCVRRRSLGTADWSEAKVKLATLVVASPAIAEGSVPGPDQVMTIAALANYLDGHATTIRSEDDAVRAAELAKQYLNEKLKNPMAPVSIWTPARQLDFAKWLHATFQHKATSIERRLDVLCSAFIDMTKVKLRKDPLGNEIETALMTHAPKFVYKRQKIARELKLPPPMPRHSTHSLETVAKVLDALDQPHLFRYAILALNTWARPEAIADFDPATQLVDGLIDLNPPGRVETTKRRARIPLSRCLAFWLCEWAREDAATREGLEATGERLPDPALITFNGERVASVKKALKVRTTALGIAKFTPGTFRHVMATTVRRLCRNVSREQRSIYLGHAVKEGSRTTDNYEAFDPDYLWDVTLATDFVMQELQRYAKRKLVSIDERLTRKEMARIGARPSDKMPMLRVV